MNALHTLIATAALVGLLMGEARAGDVNTAEHDRVADEMDRLAQRQIWAGVERKYRELERLGIPLTENPPAARCSNPPRCPLIPISAAL